MMCLQKPAIFFAFYLSLIGLVACKQKNGNNLFKTVPIHSKNIQLDSIRFDTLVLNKIETSYEGFVRIKDDSLLFIDRRFGWVFVFDTTGMFFNRHLGQGRGPKELPSGIIAFYTPKPDGGHFFIGRSNDTHNVDRFYRRIKSYRIDWNSSTSPKLLANKPNPDDPRSYNLAYGIGNIRATTTSIYLPLASAPPPYSKFNLTTDLFASQARILAKMSIKNSKIEKLMGHLSPIYSTDKNVRLFSNFSFDIIDNKTISITFQPDSLIYIFDIDFKRIESAFGFSGRNMNLDYQPFPSTKNNDKIRQYWYHEKESRGYYTSLEYIDDRNMFFRAYTKGGNSTTGGLQIYRDKTLIADVDVPKGFKVIGYIAPYFYSNAIINAEDGTIKLYRFRLDI